MGAATDGSPFHEGEKAVQERLGVRGVEGAARRMIRSYQTDEHRAFFRAQPFVLAAARDERGRPWATVLAGAPGFMSSPDPRTLVVGALPQKGDALHACLSPGSDVALLGIDFATRRRNRVSGRVLRCEGGFTLAIDQAFGNCPKYIRVRQWRASVARADAPAEIAPALRVSQAHLLRQADTLFLATGYRGVGEDPAFGMDVSHRGGEPGFVEVVSDRRLRVADYAGNNLFNSFGNLNRDPRAGLLFIDFVRGSLLQLSGVARVEFTPSPHTGGAARQVVFDIEQAVERRGCLPLRWD